MEPLSSALALEQTSQVLGKEPIVPFVILLVVLLVVPILFERLRLPAIVGLVLAGLVLGPSGWNLIHTESPMISLLSNIGLVYLMFVAGLEVDWKLWRRQKGRAFGYGGLSFAVPLLTGVLVGRIFNFGWNTSVLVGSLLGSYTLLAYPIINHLGIISNRAVTTTIGATVFTDISSLLILAICVLAFEKGVSNLSEIFPLLGWLITVSVVILLGFDWLGKEFFRRSGDDEGKKFLFVLLTVFLAVVVAQFIGIEKIFGAFLAGLAVNEAIGEGPVKEKIVFVGSVLFIPIFFINLGLLIDVPGLIHHLFILKLTGLIVVGLISSKFVAAWLAKFFYGYSWQEMLTIWSLSIPQVSTTLAAAFVGYQAGLLSGAVLTSIVFLMLVTAIVGPLLTGRTAVALTTASVTEPVTPLPEQQVQEIHNSDYTIVVPVYNPHTQQNLVEMAALLASQAQGRIVPLAIATSAAHMDAPQLEISLQRSERLLARATAHSQALGVEASALLRIDDAFAPGISRAAREQKANLIVMGWGKRTGLRARLFGNVIDNVLWSSHCPVAVTRLVESPKKIQRILVPVENLVTPTLQPVQFAQMLAEANQAQVTVLNVCDRRTSSSKIAARRSQLALLVSKLALPTSPEIQIIAHENAAQAILQAARLYDLVVLPFIRNRTSPGGLALSDVTTQLASQLTCSIVMLGEPQSVQTPTVTSGVSNSTAAV
ncbi:cation:proton antiporter [Anabaena azotica]|uniref:Cation:proton antiporter n=1 Tax=Anabaena azotica FACHB-119 TaxID=947527 RepID=A0ABR8DGD3_9NOST|nr:cation:proton antiporter [Anabaena azotica]MBD2505684.1 cation:proton antiporter [Anabaena azotica FACHB-119]